MNNEELNASINSHIKRAIPPPPPQSNQSEDNVEEVVHGNTSGGWIYALAWAVPISILSLAGQVGSGIGVIMIFLLVNKWTKEGEEIIRKDEQQNPKPKRRKKILFGEEDQL